jgi:hypothetical protein
MRPQFAQLSAAFFADKNVSIATVNCHDDIDVCGNLGLFEDDEGPFNAEDQYQEDPESTYPSRRPFFRVRNKGEWLEYNGHLYITSFVHTLNKACGTNQGRMGS